MEGKVERADGREIWGKYYVGDAVCQRLYTAR